MPKHHPDDALLLEYAGGELEEAVALIVATHLALCPNCRRKVREMEMLGGALLEDLPPEEMSAGSLDALLARLDSPEPILRPRNRTLNGGSGRRPSSPVDRRLPEPLRSYVGRLDDVRWSSLLPGVSIADVPMPGSALQPRLLRMRGRSRVPTHTHDGVELALVLDGGFHDDMGLFLPGDLAVGDASIRHTPVADPEGCLCLSLTLGSLKLTGAVGWLLHRLGRF